MNRQQLEKRVRQIAETVLKEQHYVSSIDILLGIGYLHLVNMNDWRKGKISYLERVIQVNLNKISYVMKCFRQWVQQKDLKPSEIKYMTRVCGSGKVLQFSESGKSDIEQAYRIHYFSPTMSKNKQQKLKEKLEKPPEQVVFSIIKNSQCEQCHKELFKGNFLYKEQAQALCMKCAGFADLVYLAAGDATITRRAKKYSAQYAVVVRFSRTRKRYERQGLLVEKVALQKVESELSPYDGKNQ